MAKTYTHILFDLDHTLWDFDKNSKETLTELYSAHNLKELLRCDISTFLNCYSEVNHQLWHLYSKHKISKDALRIQRFQMVFDWFKYTNDPLAHQLDIEYINICPEKNHLMPGAIQTLEYLGEKYPLHLITNGFEETQYRKLKASNLHDYFDVIVTSESTGYNKPNRKIFTHTLKAIGCSYKECIMIGDNLKTDIQGAKNVGMDHVFYNPKKTLHQYKVTYEISQLDELTKLL